MTLVRGVETRRWDEVSRLYARQTDVRHPMLHACAPLLTQEAVNHHFASAGAAVDGVLRFAARNIRIHITADPEVIVAEFEYRGENLKSGTPFVCPCVFVMRIRNGLIVESRDYLDHAAFSAAFTA